MGEFGINDLGQLDLFEEQQPVPADEHSWEPDLELYAWIDGGGEPGADLGDELGFEVDEATWLRGLPADLRASYLRGPWTGAGESMAAGFTHRDRDGRAGIGFASGGAYDTLAPGVWLAQETVSATLGGHSQLGESELVGVLCAWRRMSAWAAAGEVAAVSTLASRRAAQSRELGDPHLAEHVDDEVGAALTLTSRSAGRLLTVASALAALPAVLSALEAGVIDWAKACVFADELGAVTADQAKAIAGRLIGLAADLTTAQLRGRLRRAVLAADPDAAQERQETARKDAAVQIWDEASGNSALAGRELAPADAIAADKRITAMAKWLQAHGTTGALSQIRVAVFVALLAGRPVEALLPIGPLDEGTAAELAPLSGPLAAGSVQAGWPAVTGTVNLTMPLSAWLGGGAAGEVAGYGPVGAQTGRDLAAMLVADAASRWCLTVTDSGGRAMGHACGRRGPGTGEPVIGWAKGLCGKLELLETGSCSHARRSGRYQPPASLRHLIEIRQRTCSHRGCRRPAVACDLDHTQPFDQGGPTCECNLAPLCRRHHRAKQAPGWRLEQSRPGEMTWQLPTGRVYQTVGEPYPI